MKCFSRTSSRAVMLRTNAARVQTRPRASGPPHAARGRREVAGKRHDSSMVVMTVSRRRRHPLLGLVQALHHEVVRQSADRVLFQLRNLGRVRHANMFAEAVLHDLLERSALRGVASNMMRRAQTVPEELAGSCARASAAAACRAYSSSRRCSVQQQLIAPSVTRVLPTAAYKMRELILVCLSH